jgi:ABC-type amino acid transport substrate-binding protein
VNSFTKKYKSVSSRGSFVSCFLAVITSVFFVNTAFAEETIERLKKTNIINIGHRESSIPFSYLDPDKKPIGYSIDICDLLVKSLKRDLKLPNLKVNYVKVQASDRIPFVVEGKVDLECGNTTATVERKAKVAFTMPMFVAGAGVLVRAQEAATVLSDLKGKSIIVAAGTTGEKIITEANKSAYGLKAVSVKGNAESFAALLAGQGAAWITDDVLLASFRASAEKPDDFVLLARRHTIEPLAIVLRLNDPGFETAVDRAMLRIVQENQLQALYDKWFMNPIPPKNINLNLPPSRLLKEYFRYPTKSTSDVDLILL